jgi:hypothetical protein
MKERKTHPHIHHLVAVLVGSIVLTFDNTMRVVCIAFLSNLALAHGFAIRPNGAILARGGTFR